MRITYPKVIQESEEELKQLEHQLRGQKTADRVRMLRLLKSGTVKSLKDCAPLVGYSLVQVTRWWERYRAQGLASLTHRYIPTGQRSRLTAEAWAGLLAQMRAGRITTMQDARNYLEKEWGIVYKKHRVKWKTGRRRHKKANAEQQAAFKKTSVAC